MPFPIYRPRRLRESPLLRSMVRETVLRADDFVYPLFAVHGRGVREPIGSMPGQYRLSIEEVNRQIKLISRDFPIHCVEVTDKGVYTKIYDTPEIPLPKIASDDAHSSDECGRAWIEVQSLRGRDSILKAVKKGNFRIGLK